MNEIYLSFKGEFLNTYLIEITCQKLKFLEETQSIQRVLWFSVCTEISEKVIILGDRILRKSPVKSSDTHTTFEHIFILGQKDALWQLKECFNNDCHLVRDVLVMTKKQVNKMIRMKAKYDKSTKHLLHVSPMRYVGGKYYLSFAEWEMKRFMHSDISLTFWFLNRYSFLL